jgi:hypothetical protein
MNDEMDFLLEIPDPYAQHGDAQDHRTAQPPPKLTVASPTRTRLRTLRWRALGLGVAVAITVVAIFGHRLSRESPFALVTYGIAIPLACGMFGLWCALRDHHSRDRSFALAAMGAAVFVATAYVSQGGGSFEGSLHCISFGTPLSCALFGLAAFATRRMFVTGAIRKTVLIGISCALVGAALHRLLCGYDTLSHVLLGHGVPIVIVALLAALTARRVTQV